MHLVSVPIKDHFHVATHYTKYQVNVIQVTGRRSLHCFLISVLKFSLTRSLELSYRFI